MATKNDSRISVLTAEEILKSLHRRHVEEAPKKNHASYLAMYSSWFGGITRDPLMMTVPIDDHGFHRGDGVFEALRAIDGRAYLLDEHLARLEVSAKTIQLAPPKPRAEIAELVRECVRVAKVAAEERSGAAQAMVRIYLTRGPGSFGVSPKESPEPQIYVIVTSYNPLPLLKYEEGANVILTAYEAKAPWLARTKTLNYLINVLMKAEATAQGSDFSIGLDPRGNILESSTENIVVVTAEGRLAHPPLDNVLAGCTMLRLFDLVEKEGMLPTSRNRELSQEDLMNCREAFLIGTSLDVLPVRSVNGRALARGPWCDQLRALLRKDQSTP